MKIYIGVVGQIAAGKEVLAEYLIKKYGFSTFSLSTVLHRELAKRGETSFTRKTLQDVGDEMRKKYGDDVLAKRTIEILNKHEFCTQPYFKSHSGKPRLWRGASRIDSGQARMTFWTSQNDNNKQLVVITGIRNPAEVKYFRTIENFILVAVCAKRKVRFQRVLRRGKPWDPKTWEQFYKTDRRDFGIGQEKSGQQVGACIKMADYTLTNNKDLESFYGKIEKLIKYQKSNIK